MIKTTELRLGNLIYDSDYKSNITVKAIQGNPLLYEHWHPIELTPEILEKCGFVEKENRNSDGDEISWQQLHLQGGRNFFTYYWGKLDIHDGDIDLSHIKYLHQLQNLFFYVTGEELNVQL